MKQDPLKLLGIIVTMISIMVSVALFFANRDLKVQGALDAARIAQQMDIILQTKARIQEANERIAGYQQQINQAMAQEAQHRERADSLMLSAQGKDTLIKQLYEKLNQDPVALPGDDMEQLRIFLRWTKAP